MAKYDDIYPDAQEDFISNKHDKQPPVMKWAPAEKDEEAHICVCGAHSDWVNATAMRFVCSTECNAKVWDILFNIFVTQQILGDST